MPSAGYLKTETVTARAKRREYDRGYFKRQYTGHGSGLSKGAAVVVPDDIERREWHEPCLLCGAARECRHRP